MRGIGDPESLSTTFFVTVGVLVVVVVVLLMVGYFNAFEQRLERERLVERTIDEVAAYEREQRELLETYGPSEGEGSEVRIPIEQAMEIVAERKGAR